MKLLVLGDIHGRTIWEEIIQNEDFDSVIFMGDYFDSYTIGGEQQIENFKQIIKFKESFKNCTLLIGNHDCQYLNFWQERYSGFQNGYQYTISHLLHTYLDKLQMCCVIDEYCFTHAGVSTTWCTNNNIDIDNLEQSINDRWKYKPLSFMFYGKDSYGDNVTQSPVWIRPNSLLQDGLKEYIHVVGHTPVPDITYKGNIIGVDALEHKKYLKLEL